MMLSSQLAWPLRLSLAALTFVAALMVQPALAGADAEKFMQGLIDQGFTILKDKSGGEAQRKARFHDFVVQNIDTEKTGLFALGQYRRDANPADLGPYAIAFRDYVTAVYEARLSERSEQSLKVTGSLDNKADDVTVNAQANDPNATDPVKIAFRLNGANGSYKVVDVQAAGVWLSIEQRDAFATFLGKNKGDIKALTADLTARAQKIRNAGKSS
ncbi:MAG: ABC transporter substrate-binding protein [Alphaproteobacteria bacterium]|jgi:phospholipid transport system substrate-binding protein|nr:ABC transporter substrate-binding protein [Alphaproteobacteria bacterium]